MKLVKLSAHEILDSRGNPTVKVTGVLENGMSDGAEVPSGASKGTFEALELRDNDPHRYKGQGVLQACKNVDIIFETIKDIDIENQRDIDIAMINLDGTVNKSRLGTNAMLGVSFVCMKLAAKANNRQYFEQINQTFNTYYKKNILPAIPVPMFNILNGGQHADNGVDFQEFLVIPIKHEGIGDLINGTFLHETSASERIRMGSEILHTLKGVLKDSGMSTGIGDEGGFAPEVRSAKDALNLICEAVMKTGYKLFEQVSLGIDCASNYFYDASVHEYIIDKKGESPHYYNADAMKDFYKFFLEHYPLVYLEDFYSEEDWDAFTSFTNDDEINKIAFTGDDLVVTNPQRLKKAIETKAINAVIVKPNQIGTLHETFEVVNMCIDNNVLYVPSHRSGETDDSFITDIAVGLGAKMLKAGAPQRGERIAKYNRLLEIEQQING